MRNSSTVERYVQSCQTVFWQGVFQAEIRYILQHLAGSKEVLSVGCGPATIESALSEHGFHVTGLDVSKEALGRAPDTIRTVAGRAEDMPFPEACFDAAIYVASLQFIEDYERAIERTTYVLRPGGRLIVMLLNPGSEFFKARLSNPNSYIHKIRHTDLKEIEGVIARDYIVRTEYYLGVKDNAIFTSQDPSISVLYIIRGTKRQQTRKG